MSAAEDHFWLAFAGGGTGGHLTQAVAVAQRVVRLDGRARVAMLCSQREIDRRMLEGVACVERTVPQPVIPLPAGAGRLSPLAWGGFWMRWRRRRPRWVSSARRRRPSTWRRCRMCWIISARR